jgi:hypothetical protein
MVAQRMRAAALAVGLSAGFAGAASAQEPAARVEYRYFGQGAYTLVIPARAYETQARREVRTGDRWAGANMRVLETGQGRYTFGGDPVSSHIETANTAERDDR